MPKVKPKPKPPTEADRAYLAQMAEPRPQLLPRCHRHPDRECGGYCQYVLPGDACAAEVESEAMTAAP